MWLGLYSEWCIVVYVILILDLNYYYDFYLMEIEEDGSIISDDVVK